MSAQRNSRPFDGPFEHFPWPDRLTARVVTPGPEPRVFGYDVEGDLARHYRFSDLVYLSLTGELPAGEAGAAFEVALLFLAPAPITDAPAHAGVLARVCGASTSATVGVGAVTLAEQARWIVAEHAAWLGWLAEPSGEPPARFCARDPDALASVARLRALLDARGARCDALACGPTRDAALIALLHGAGLTRPEQIEPALVVARLPAVIAEAMAAAVGGFRDYPMNLPPIQYHEEER